MCQHRTQNHQKPVCRGRAIRSPSSCGQGATVHRFCRRLTLHKVCQAMCCFGVHIGADRPAPTEHESSGPSGQGAVCGPEGCEACEACRGDSLPGPIASSSDKTMIFPSRIPRCKCANQRPGYGDVAHGLVGDGDPVGPVQSALNSMTDPAPKGGFSHWSCKPPASPQPRAPRPKVLDTRPFRNRLLGARLIKGRNQPTTRDWT